MNDLEKNTKEMILDIIVLWTNEKFPEESENITFKEANDFVNDFYERYLKKDEADDSV